ncbi:AAA family ATPase [Methylibium sp. Pch-M]|uniref:TniB family NTP-binding protein n=1 Tax=Methylibium sp. Pch-M TaxID=2082386 RepID=UPI00101209C3|nr:TniB family NTP-binding protein [Methylibium sp. Pch-M]QAZ39570.1 AAA family ATPase [Methylibium sp. Pch-M]
MPLKTIETPASTDLAESIKDALDATFLRVTHVKELLRELEACLRTGQRKAKPRHLVIFGESGVGKSKLLEVFSGMHPRLELADRSVIPVLRASMPSLPTPKRIVVELLKAMGSPFATKGKDDEPILQLKTLCTACGVQLVLLDEVSHLVDRGREKTHYRYGDALKEVVDALGIPFVLTGIPRLMKLFDVNEQLRGRFSRRRTIKPFSIVGDKRLEEFRSVVHSFRAKFKGIDSIDLTTKELLPRVFMATNGLLRPLVDLLKEAVELAARTKGRSLTRATLEAAFDAAIWNEAPKTRNPFAEDFNFVPLIQTGEPYATPERDL